MSGPIPLGESNCSGAPHNRAAGYSIKTKLGHGRNSLRSSFFQIFFNDQHPQPKIIVETQFVSVRSVPKSSIYVVHFQLKPKTQIFVHAAEQVVLSLALLKDVENAHFLSILRPQSNPFRSRLAKLGVSRMPIML